tara:strand:+ start:3474 stop:3644 length:171 start_codon:yes stop_codon:yes gene_type:complete
MRIGNKNTIPAISNLPGQGNHGGGPIPPVSNFIALESALTNLMALESGLTNKAELE